MKKILFITSLSGKTVNAFMKSAIYAAKECGFEFHLACNFSSADTMTYEEQAKQMGFVMHQINICRSPFSFKNIRAKKELEQLMSLTHFDIIHCNTPIGGVIGRLAARKTNNPNVIYTAHGFHFYKGGPLWNWIAYYPVEVFLGKYTKLLLTINKEDYQLAIKRKMCSNIRLTHGVGINTSVFKTSFQKNNIRQHFGIPQDKVVILNIGELNKNKNQITFLKTIKTCKSNNAYFIMCGRGKMQKKLLSFIKRHKINDKVKYIDYIPYDSIHDLYAASDIFCFTTKREGLPSVSLEAMASGLPCVLSNIRGNNDLIEDGIGGFLVDCNDYKRFAKRVDELCADPIKRKEFGLQNIEKAKEYDIGVTINELKTIYCDCVKIE